MDQPITPQLPALPFDLSGAHNPLSLGLFGELLFGLWVIMTLVFLYHWWKYSPSKLVAFHATTIYLIGSIIINIIITGALAAR